MHLSELSQKTARDIVKLLQTKAISPQELLDIVFARTAEVEPHINAIPTLCPERARVAASGLADDTMLAGLPIAVKDLTVVAGVRTTFGTRGYADFVPDQTDPLIERLEERGAIVIGKSNTPEMGAGGNTFNDVFGATRNPWNTAMNAGGSSGGAAAALATGEVWLAHGSDLGGSLRTPAAYCGVVGLRPSPGRAGGGSVDNVFGIEGVQGPMARNVRDCALFLDAMSGFDPRQPISLEPPASPFLAATETGLKPSKIAYSPHHDGVGEVEPEIDQILRAALTKLEPSVAIEEACPHLPDLDRIYTILRAVAWAAGAGRQPEHIQQHFKAALKENIALATSYSIDDIVDAITGRSVIYHAMCHFLGEFDLLASPVVGLEPGPVEIEYPQSVNGVATRNYLDWLRYSFLATTAGLPALSLPVGFTKSGMPVGIQLIGPARGEAKLLAMAAYIEDRLGIAGQVPINPRPAT